MCRESFPENLTECIRRVLFSSQSLPFVLRDYLDRLQPPQRCFVADAEVKRQVSYVVELKASHLRGAAPLCAHGTTLLPVCRHSSEIGATHQDSDFAQR